MAMDRMNPPEKDPTFPTPPVRDLIWTGVETLVSTLVCGVVIFGGYVLFLWVKSQVG